MNHLRLSLHHSHNFSSLDKHLQAEAEKLAQKNKGAENTQDDLGVGSEEEDDSILNLDPKEWKKHDYYKVLGLSHLRHKATPEQIKWAHRKKVLKHHPDKKAATTGSKEDKSQFLAGVNLNTNDDAFFKCISKAHEVLSNPEKRRQFDSVDPAFLEAEEDMPGEKEVKVRSRLLLSGRGHANGGLQSKNFDFFKTFTHVFDLYSRFSKIQPVPGLGHIDSTKEEVESFYDFWYNFDSWRSFEWLDKEVNEGSDS